MSWKARSRSIWVRTHSTPRVRNFQRGGMICAVPSRNIVGVQVVDPLAEEVDARKGKTAQAHSYGTKKG